jgi:hypothetical protein
MLCANRLKYTHIPIGGSEQGKKLPCETHCLWEMLVKNHNVQILTSV